MIEVWKPLNEEPFNGLYAASNLGRIKTLGFIVQRTDGKKQTFPEKILKQSVLKLGYHRICIRANGKSKNFLVHRLVCQAHIGYSEMHVNHKDSDKSNNRIDNLEYVTPRDNMAHRSVKNGWMVGTTKKYNGKFQANITKDKKIYCLGTFDTQQEAHNAYVKKTKEYGEELKYV